MLSVAFGNTERAFGKAKMKEPWDFFHIAELAVFAVLIVPLLFHFFDFPTDKSLRYILCDINYIAFSSFAFSAILSIKRKGCFKERIRLTVLLAALAMPLLIFMLIIDIISATGHIKLFGIMLENGFVSIICGLIPIAETVALYSFMNKWLIPKGKEENEE